jgi:hypothetical protein
VGVEVIVSHKDPQPTVLLDLTGMWTEKVAMAGALKAFSEKTVAGPRNASVKSTLW